MATRSSAAAVALALVAFAACTAPAPSPRLSADDQQVACGRLSQDRCGQVIGAVQAQVPDTKRSALAIADYALPALPSEGANTYLVAFKPWGTDDLWMNPPTWLVSGSPGEFTVTPVTDVKDLSVCFIVLLRDAGLTDYAPTFPSGFCG